MEITSGYHGTFTKLTLAGQFCHYEDMIALENHFRKKSTESHRPVIIDMERLTFINSQGLGLLVKLYSLCNESDGKLILYLPQSTVREVVEISGLSGFITIVDTIQDLDAALRRFQ